ncbi:hypothetical protein [Anaerosporobacter faecicola]|uniref:hypothetical protein n=1 Tax=Anaerosporobacter faecicola TaxID=2718714 RepID=UPI00143C6087|nr:hypothetical protein [Anaerosporobacter faecicola]
MKNKKVIWKKFVAILLVVTMVGPNLPWGISKIFADDVIIPFSGGGTGTQSDPYILKNAEDFILLQEEIEKCAVMKAFTGVYFRVDSYTAPEDASGQAIIASGSSIGTGESIDGDIVSGSSIENNKEIGIVNVLNLEEPGDSGIGEGEEEEDDYNQIPDIDLTEPIVVGEESKTFTGIGSSEHYFCGTFQGGGTRIKINTPLFNYVGDHADISKLTILGDVTDQYQASHSIGGLALAVITDTAGGDVSFKDILVNANVTGGNIATGGLIGTCQIKKQMTLTLTNIKVTGTISNQTNSTRGIGGLIGYVENQESTKTAIVDVLIDGTTTVQGNYINNRTNTGLGCLIGELSDRIRVAIDGTIDLSKVNEVSGKVEKSGYAFGVTNHAFIYRKENAQILLPSTYILDKVGEVGNGGTVYINPIVDPTAENYIPILGTGTVDDPYQLKSSNDFMVMAIALNTKLFFAGQCFDLTQKPSKMTDYAYLLQANYKVMNDVDLSNTGILRLNLPYYDSQFLDAFSGSFYGMVDPSTGVAPTITLNMNTMQADVALFAQVCAPSTANDGDTGVASFHDLLFTGSITGGTKVATLFSRGFIGDKVNGKVVVQNITSAVNITSSLDGTANTNATDPILEAGNACGGIAGYNSTYYCKTKKCEFIYDNVTYSGTMNGLEGFFGGLLGYYGTNNSNDVNQTNNLTIQDYTFSGEISTRMTLASQTSKSSGMVSYIGVPFKKTVTTNGISHYVYYNKTNVSCKNITIKDALIMNPSGDVYITGGFLGYQWNQVDATVENLTVDNSTINTTGYVGGLWYGVTGKLALEKVQFNKFLIYQNNADRNLDAGMIRNAYELIMTIKGYRAVDSAMIYGSANFDDIAAVVTDGRTTSNNMTYYNGADRTCSGLISLEDDPDWNQYYRINEDAEKGYCVYSHQMGLYTDQAKYLSHTKKEARAPRTRIYYNLFKDWDTNKITGTGTKQDPFVIDTEEKMMILASFNTIHYKQRFELLSYFADYTSIHINTAATADRQTKDAAYVSAIRLGYFIITADLDLSTYSYYPMNIEGGSYYGFDLMQFCTKEGITNPTKEQKETYIKTAVAQLAAKTEVASDGKDYRNYKPTIKLDASPLINHATVIDDSKKNGISTPNSRFSYHYYMQSALFTNVVSYNGTNVEFNNLQLEGNISGSYEQDYSRDVWGIGGALITKTPYYGADEPIVGQNYGINRANVSIRNIDIGDLKVTSYGASDGSSVYGSGLLVSDIFQSTVEFDGIRLLEGSNAYAEALIGAVGGEGTTVAFKHIKLGQGSNNKVMNFRYASLIFNYSQGTAVYNYDGQDLMDKDYTPNDEYPYAYKKLPVIVNPMSADIIEGNGTKNNPFIIDSAEQLLTLSTFLYTDGALPVKQTDPLYEPTDPNWYVGDYVNNATATNMLNNSNILDYLRTAYYKLENDINFNAVQDAFKSSAWDFSGIGSESQPFAGVFDGNNHTIILSQKGLVTKPESEEIENTVTDYSTYGLFAYIKGATIKNIIFADLDHEGYTKWYKKGMVSGSGGSVAACVIGGDNVIENIVLNNSIYIRKDGANKVGGLIGELRGGTVLLRRMTEQQPSPFKNLHLYNVNSGKASGAYTGSVVGSVFNGCIIYDGYEDTTVAAIPKTATVFTNSFYTNLMPCKYSGIVNKAYLDLADPIAVSYDSSNGYHIAIEDNRQLLIAALTLNSGSFSIVAREEKNCYYDSFARTKKMDSDDDSFRAPTLYRYFAVDGTKLIEAEAYKKTQTSAGDSYLNAVDNTYLHEVGRRTTYELTAAEGYEYDMTASSIDTVFRGLGGMTNVDNPNAYMLDNLSVPTFRANFDGKEHTVKLAIDNTYNSQTVGFFNDLYVKASSITSFTPFTIANLTLTGSVKNTTSRGGMVAGAIYGKYSFENVIAEDFQVTSTSYAGGLIGKQTSTSKYTDISFTNCQVRASSPGASTIKGSTYVGGVIGYTSNGRFILDTITVDGLVIAANSTSNSVYMGGLVGGYISSQGYVIERKFTNIQIKDTTVKANALNIGGVFGYVAGSGTEETYINGLFMKDNIVSRTRNYAKTVGYYTASSDMYFIKPEITGDGMETLADSNREDNAKNGHVYLIYLNPFDDLEKAETLYGIDRDSTAYGELIATDIFNGDEDIEGNTLVKYSAESGMIQNVVDNVLKTLTNNSATLDSGIVDHMTIDTVKMKVTDCVAEEVPDETASIKMETVAGKPTFIVNNYDTKDAANKNGTYTTLRFTYTFGDYVEKIDIPVYVDNMIDTDMYTKIMIGKISNPEDFKTSTQANITVTNNSSYTIYSEFVYGNLRLSYDVSDMVVDKVFTFTDNVAFSKGSKLTLIDLTIDGKPKVYYYTVTTKNMMNITLESFKDVNGNPYVSRDITKESELATKANYITMTNKRKRRVGVERYLLQVDNSAVDVNTANTADTKFHPRIECNVEKNEDLAALFIRERFAVELTNIEGRYIRFKKDSMSTEGSISRNVMLSLNATFINEANETYRDRAMATDSVNKGKYLDMAIYLLDQDGNKILFPVGTMVRMGSSQEFHAISNTSVVYYYKESGTEYALQNSPIDDVVDLNLEFNFLTAKMETLPPGNYRIGVDLVRTSDKAYPFGGETLDSMTSQLIKVTEAAEYGLAMEVKDYKELAVNKAESTLDSYPMNFTLHLSTNLSKEQLGLLSNSDLKLAYTIEKKDAITGLYKAAEVDAPKPVITMNVNGTGESNLEGYTAEFYMNKENFIDSVAAENYITRDITIHIPKEVEAANYRIEVELIVEGNVVASDYVIANIADIQ